MAEILETSILLSKIVVLNGDFRDGYLRVETFYDKSTSYIHVASFIQGFRKVTEPE